VSQVESQLVLAGAPPTELSVQQVTSCATLAEDDCCDGCGGGDPTAAYDYLLDKDLTPEAFWPFAQSLRPEDDACEGPDCTARCDRPQDLSNPGDYEFVGPFAKVRGYSLVSECDTNCEDHDVSDLVLQLASSPVSVCLNAETWDDYTGGVLSAAACGDPNAIDHCVQAVGYNATADPPYFVVRNQWDAAWGENGYIRLQLDANTCGIANEASIVHLDGQWEPPSGILIGANNKTATTTTTTPAIVEN